MLSESQDNLNPMVRIFKSITIPDTWREIKSCDIILVKADEDCGYIFEGKPYSPLLDSLGELFRTRGLKVCSIYVPYSVLKSEYSHDTSVSYNRIEFAIAFLGKLIRIFFNRSRCVNWKNKQRIKLWCKILKTAKPHYVIGIQPIKELCAACKMRGVVIYDLQHGQIDDQNPWYSKSRHLQTPEMNLPNGYLLWDYISSESICKWSSEVGIDIRVIGNPWFSRFAFPQKNDTLVCKSLNSNKIINSDRPTLLISLQWGIGKYYNHSEFNGVMLNSLELTILETACKYNWLIRLHPVQIRGGKKDMVLDYLKNTFGHITSVEWRRCSELPLPVVLSQTDLHITDFSSIVIEAGWMGIPSGLLNRNIGTEGSLQNMYAYERSIGLAEILSHDPSMIKGWIKEKLTKGKNHFSNAISENHLYDFIDEICSSIRKSV